MLKIHGENGKHASDIKSRGLFDGTADNEQSVVVPIFATRYVVSLLLQEWISGENIVNLSGLMSTSPSWIHNLHFLFGPNAQENLFVATAGNISKPGRVILDNAEKKGIWIIETSREEHDRKMAVIQWLANFLLVFIWRTADEYIRKSLIEPWKTTESTIQDMIFQNNPVESLLNEFFYTLKINKNDPLKTFWCLVGKYLRPEDIEKFSTPNFRRIMGLIEEGVKILLDPEYIDKYRDMLKQNGHLFIGRQISLIRAER